MRAGDVIFVKPSGLLSGLVAKIDGSPFSHVAMAVSETHIVEAQAFTRSRITPITERETLILDLGLTDEQRDTIQDYAIAATGKWYDYSLIAGYFFRNVLKLDFKALWNSQNNLICSELVAGLLILAKYEGAEGLQNQNISPRELLLHLSAYELKKKGRGLNV